MAASEFSADIQKQVMSIPGAFTNIATHIPQLIGLSGTVWVMRRLTDGLDTAYGAAPTSGYGGLPISEQLFRAGEEALAFVIKLKDSMITGLDKVDELKLTK